MHILERYAFGFVGVTYLLSVLVMFLSFLLKYQLNIITHLFSLDLGYFTAANGIVIMRVFKVNMGTVTLHSVLMCFALLSIVLTSVEHSLFCEECYTPPIWEVSLIAATMFVQSLLAVLAYNCCAKLSPRTWALLTSIHCHVGVLCFIALTWIFLVQMQVWHYALFYLAQGYVLFILFLLLTPYFDFETDPNRGTERMLN